MKGWGGGDDGHGRPGSGWMGGWSGTVVAIEGPCGNGLLAGDVKEEGGN